MNKEQRPTAREIAILLFGAGLYIATSIICSLF